MKPCIACHQVKPLTEFHANRRMRDGRLNKCRSCVVEYVAQWRTRNPDVRKIEHAKNRSRLGIRPRAEYNAIRAASALGRAASSLAYFHRRRARTEPRSELDDFAFAEAARLARLRERATGFAWHLDHIVPINHRSACGLHVAANFQVVPAPWNVSKGNRSMATYFPV